MLILLLLLLISYWKKEKEKCQLNLIVHQLEVTTQKEPQARKAEDIEVCSKLIRKYLGLSSTVTNAIRIGSKGVKPHLLKLSVNSKREKSLILKNCTKLHNKDPQVTSKESTLPQILLPKSRKKIIKALRNKLAELNQMGKNYKIKKTTRLCGGAISCLPYNW